MLHARTLLAQILERLLTPVRTRLGAQVLVRPPSPEPRARLMVLTWWRLTRLLPRLDRLVRRWQQGEDLTPRRRPAPPPAPVAARPAAARPAAASADPPACPAGDPRTLRDVRLPRGRGWLVRLWPSCPVRADSLRILLARDDTRALVEAAPQAGRLLRPLCRMFGTDLPDWLRLPPRPRKPRPKRPRPKRPRPKRPRPASTSSPRPLPAYVRAAVRAWKPRYG